MLLCSSGESPKDASVNFSFINREAIISMQDIIAEFFINIANDQIYAPLCCSWVIMSQSYLDKIAIAEWIFSGRSIIVPNISHYGSIAISIHNPLYKLLSGTLTMNIDIRARIKSERRFLIL